MAENGKIGQATLDQNKKCEKTFREKYCEFIQKHRSFGVILLFFLLYVSCITFFEDIIAKTLVEHFFSYVKPNFFSQAVFLLIFGYLIIRTFLTKPKLHSPSKYLIYVISLGLLVYYRLISDKYEWISLATIRIIDIKYIDVVAVYAVGVFLRSIIDVLIMCHRKDVIPQDGFVRDIPIDKEDDDIFNRSMFARDAVDIILKTSTANDSFSFGIVSPWGTGKTSFTNLMKEQIERAHKEECLVVNFNPWLYSNDANIVDLFFDELSKVLRPYDSRLAINFIDYSKALSSIGTSETKIASAVIDLMGERLTIEDKVDIIKKSIKKINKKIVIFVDDIDRLESNELMDVLKLIRNNSNFPNIYFVVAYDKEYLLGCLKDKMPTKELNFSEKIFQAEFSLPPLEKTKIKDCIYITIARFAQEGDKKELYDLIYEDNTFFGGGRGIIDDNISTLRDAKRVVNSFYISYLSLKGEVKALDLFIFEILKTKYPTVYSILERDRSKVLKLNNYNCYELYKEEKDGNDTFWDTLTNPNKYNLGKHINENYPELHIKESDIGKIENILYSLFPPHSMGISEKSINNIFHIDRYFAISILESDISDLEFDKVINDKDIVSIMSKFKEWSVNRANALSARLKEYNVNDKAEQEKYIKLLIYSTSIMPFDIYHITEQINRLKEFNNNKSFSKEDKRFIKDLLCESGYSKGLAFYLYNIVLDSNDADYPLTINDLNDIRQILFKKCIDENFDVFQNVLEGYQYTMEVRLEDGKQKSFPIPANKKLMKEYIISHLQDFIKRTIVLDAYPDKYHVNKWLPSQFWDTWEDYISFIKSMNDNNPIIDEYLAFVEKCKGSIPPKEYVDFKFKHIKINET